MNAIDGRAPCHVVTATTNRDFETQFAGEVDRIGTDGVLDLHAGDADVAIRYVRTLPADGLAREFLSDSFWPFCSPELVASGP